MANNNINVLQTLIQLRRGTEEQWNLVKDTFIPREGEPCTTIYDDGRDALIKIGDGKHTWGQLGYIRDSFLVTINISESGEITADKTQEEILKAIEQNKVVYAKLLGPNDAFGVVEYLSFAGILVDGNEKTLVFINNGVHVFFFQNGQVSATQVEYMTTSELTNDNFSAQGKSIVELADSNELTSAVTRGYTDNSTPTFIYLEEQNGVIKSKVTDLNTLKTALMSQTNGYTQTSNPLYKAVKCYAMLNGNCYDLVYSSQENASEVGKVAIVKRTFYAVTTDGLNKLNVVIDENQTDENQKVVWTKEAQGIASEQFVVTVQDVDGVSKSDKTPAEIAAAAKSGKQVILKDNSQDVVQFCYLINADNNIATFCGSQQLTEKTADSDPIVARKWYTIFNDKTIIATPDLNLPSFIIEKDGSGKYTSVLNPWLLMEAAYSGSAGNVFLSKDVETFIGTIYITAERDLHIYFPDYAKNKLYDLKWNGGQNPSTYTFTELTLDEKPMVVTFTFGNDGVITADKTIEEVDAAYKSGIPIYGREGGTSGNVVFSLTYGDIDNKEYYFTSIIPGMDSVLIVYSATGFEMFRGSFMICNNGENKWNAQNFRIINLGSPTDPSDAATKGYVDTSLAAKTEQFVVTVQEVDGVDKSDKTPAEIKAAVEAGKQVVLKIISGSENDTVTNTGFLVSVVNDIASFCLFYNEAVDSISGQQWISILGDKTAKGSYSVSSPLINIEKDTDGKYYSDLSPELYLALLTSDANIGTVTIIKDDSLFIGTISYDVNSQTLHFYFPDYKNNKLYDLKWNKDENPSTYTFTELSLDKEPLIVNITSPSEGEFVADKTYAEIVAAIESGQKVQCDSDLFLGYSSSSYYTYNKNASVTFIVHAAIGDYGQIKDNFMSVMIAVNITKTDKITMATAYLPMPAGLPFISLPNRILKTDENGAMKYVEADTYLVKQPTSDEREQFLSIDMFGRQRWENPLTVGNSDSVVIKSSTPNSTKKFRITVDDAGTISATEVT